MKKEITVIEKQVSPIVTQAQSIKIVDSESLNKASDLRVKIKEAIDYVEQDKEKIYRPIKDALDEVNNRYKPWEKSLEEALKTINSRMTKYQTEVYAAQKKEEERIAKQLSKGKIDVETAIEKIEAVAKVESTIETNFVNMPELVIENIAKIPREYLIPDEKKIKAALSAGISVPGAVMKDRLVPKSR